MARGMEICSKRLFVPAILMLVGPGCALDYWGDVMRRPTTTARATPAAEGLVLPRPKPREELAPVGKLVRGATELVYACGRWATLQQTIAEGTGLEPATGEPAPEFQSGR